MALRTIREYGDPVLRKVCKPVKEMTPHLKTIIRDMYDTMYEADGVGLAGPQIGIRKRVCVVDVGEHPVTLINPEVLETEGEQEGTEGCLSVPRKYGLVKRPSHVKVKALDENMQERILEADDLEARAFLHEMDHLDGKLYTDLVIGELHDAGDMDVEEEER